MPKRLRACRPDLHCSQWTVRYGSKIVAVCLSERSARDYMRRGKAGIDAADEADRRNDR